MSSRSTQSVERPRRRLAETAVERPRKRLDPTERERMILEAAIEFFAENGFAAQTRELARQIGVSQALIFRYFGTKDALIERVYQTIFLERWNPAWEDLVRDRSRPLRDRLKSFYRAYFEAVDDRRWIRIAMLSSLAGRDLTRRYVQTQIARLLGTVVDEIRAERDGAVDPADLNELAWHLHSTVIYYLIRKHIHGTPVKLPTDRIVELAVDNFLDGLGGQGPAPRKSRR